MERLDEAVERILAVKLAFGLVKKGWFEHEDHIQSKQFKQPLHKTSEYEDALTAAHQSMVLLKNQDVIPLNRDSI